MREGISPNLSLSILKVILLLHWLIPFSPCGVPRPLLPLLAPSPQTPFLNYSVPKLSGLCTLNFTAAETMLSITATDCLSVFAPYLAGLVCCPQVEAALVILLGQYSKDSKSLALNENLAKHCLSDVEQILANQGASNNLRQICSIRPSNLTEATCPVKEVSEFEGMVDSFKLLSACENIDPVKECCDQTCQNAISEAATKIASRPYDSPEDSTIFVDCKSIVLRWLASKLSPPRAKDVIRGLSNCHVNKGCPLVFPDISRVAKRCGNGTDNHKACCDAMGSYMSILQNQSFVTNLQALNCAASLGMKLQKENITENVYSLCQITLKDFSVQASFGVQSGCLLPSLPTDVTLDKSAGVSFLCDLNDNIPAPWSTTSRLPVSSCNKSVKIPALPAVASAQSGLNNKDSVFSVFFTCVAALMMALFG